MIQGFLLYFIQIYLKLLIIIIIIIIIKHLTDDTHKHSNKNLHNLFLNNKKIKMLHSCDFTFAFFECVCVCVLIKTHYFKYLLKIIKL